MNTAKLDTGYVAENGWLYVPRPAYWGAWILAALYNLCRDVFFAPMHALLVYNAAYFGVWSLLGLAAIPLMRRFPLRLHWRSWLFHGVAAALFVQADVTVGLWLGDRLMGRAGSATWADIALRAFRECFNLGLMTYAGLFAIVQVSAMRAHARQRELQLAEQQTMLVRAQLDNLKAQLQPHFLFNTLHAIGSLMHYDLATADRVLKRLGDVLRLALRDSGRQEVTLAEELELVSAYVEIERIRFENRLAVEWLVPDALQACRIPPFVLQPLVENAIKHGVAPYADGGDITIRAYRADDGLVLEVENKGRAAAGGAGASRRPGMGVGLANIRGRLEALYGAGQERAAALDLVNTENGALARVTLPGSAAGNIV
ncbi:hypothetical protein GCM10027277_41140 [Pseudoduganella ginsengisoli]|uniref:Uncharacterized protein n=1 Tax=Pseudoduganella ginsengisoli TaxID=1462440 RepID=A0A6L6PWC2_9BURK|nr:histidine kinase [Pseudoduganella ginsengisoli]MTW01817.1 hypothetical protein [Pseudoduganella ginsengisoli]